MRGIINTTGTACHVSAALIVLAHSIRPVSDGIILASSHPDASDFVATLGALLLALNEPLDSSHDARDIRDGCSRNTAIDPTDLFAVLRTTIHVETHDLGDAVTALLKILHHIEAGSSDLCHISSDLLYSGRVYSTLTGRRSSSDTVTKQLKERRLANPYPLQLRRRRHNDQVLDSHGDDSIPSFLDVLHETFAADDVVDGYQWPESQTTNTMDGWETTKRLHVTAFPPIFMMHLQRFELYSTASVSTRTSLQPIDNTDGSRMDIPSTLDLNPYVSSVQKNEDNVAPSDSLYHLTGGILHVSDPDVTDADEEDGHYVAAVCTDNQWYLVDDDDTSLASMNQVLAWLGGSFYQSEASTTPEVLASTETVERESRLTPGSYLRGVLLVYHQEGASERAAPILQAMNDSLPSHATQDVYTSDCAEQRLGPSCEPTADKCDGVQRVGRRLRVQWSGGSFYSGRVSSYDAASGKHTVTYDDGDVRQYNLSKKTIEWLGESVPPG